MSPLVFAALYISSVAVGVLFNDSEPAISISGTLVALALQVGWPISALWRLVLASKGSVHEHAISRFRMSKYMAGYIVISATIVLLLNSIPINTTFNLQSSWASIAMPLAVGLGVVCWFGMSWIAAISLCEVEEKKMPKWHHAIGTFLQFLYIVIGAFFLNARIRHAENAGRIA